MCRFALLCNTSFASTVVSCCILFHMQLGHGFSYLHTDCVRDDTVPLKQKTTCGGGWLSSNAMVVMVLPKPWSSASSPPCTWHQEPPCAASKPGLLSGEAAGAPPNCPACDSPCWRQVTKQQCNGGDGLAQALVICQQPALHCRLGIRSLPVQHPGQGSCLMT